MIDPKALEKVVKDGISIVSFKDGKIDSARMIRDARVDWSGRVCFRFPKDSALTAYFKNTDAFTLSVLMEGTNVEAYEVLFLRFDTDYYAHESKFSDLKCTRRDQNGLKYITDCTNAIISCKIDEITEDKNYYCVCGVITQSQLLHDDPTLTEDVYWRTLRKHFNSYVCSWCGMLYIHLHSDPEYCIFCNSRLYEVF